MSKCVVSANVVSLRFHSYYDWLATGMGMLADEGRIEFSLRRSPWMRAIELHKYIMPGIRKYIPGVARWMDPSPAHYLLGEVRCADKRVRFLYDIDDSPIHYWDDMLDRVDLYFKCQCPLQIAPEGFPLNSRVFMPYSAKVLQYVDVIRPAMVGRPLSRTLSFRKNLVVLKRWEELARVEKTIRLFAIYTYDRGYPASDVPGEGTLVRDYGDRIHHPERKRGELVKWMKDRLDREIDVCICRSEDPALRGPFPSDEEYPGKVARSALNINIAGYGRSIPFRFIDSFLVGTSVATDELALRWYQPLEENVEIFNLGKLGYELPQDADWDLVKERLTVLHEDAPRLHASVKDRILDNYRRKWHPERLAEYIIREAEKLM